MKVCLCTLGKDGRCCQDRNPSVVPAVPPIPWSPPPGLLPEHCSQCYAETPIGANYCPGCGVFRGMLGRPVPERQRKLAEETDAKLREIMNAKV